MSQSSGGGGVNLGVSRTASGVGRGGGGVGGVGGGNNNHSPSVRPSGTELRHVDAARNSDKFYRVVVCGRSVIRAYGRTGSAGQVQVGAFDSAAKATAHGRDLVANKLAKGYVGLPLQLLDASLPADTSWLSPAEVKTLLRHLAQSVGRLAREARSPLAPVTPDRLVALTTQAVLAIEVAVQDPAKAAEQLGVLNAKLAELEGELAMVRSYVDTLTKVLWDGA